MKLGTGITFFAVQLGLRYRYLAIALAVNTPENSIIEGGGSIMMMAGLSGIFPLSRPFWRW